MNYIFHLNNPRPTVGPAENNVFMLLQEIIAYLQSQGYTTRGSSTFGSGFSATPDGVDRWTGQVYTDVLSLGPDPVWFVLQAPTGGSQIIFELKGTGGLTFSNFVFSVNGFEDSGAWRNVASNIVRPQDITSTPASSREITTGQWFNNFGTGAYHIILQDDYRGLMIMDILDSDSGGSGSFLALNELTNPVLGDNNPFVILCSSASDSGFAASTYIPTSPAGQSPSNLVGRTDTTITNFGLTTLGAVLFGDFTDILTGPDLFSGKEVEMPLALWTDVSPKYFRSSLRDIRRTRMSLPYGTTFNGLQRIVFGNLSFPWDGTTSLGQADLPSQVYELNSSASGNGGQQGTVGKFNLGLEKI